MAGPVLRVHRIVLHGGVEPQAVALLAVIEGSVERAAPAASSPAAPAATAAPAGRAVVVGVLALGARLVLGAGLALRLVVLGVEGLLGLGGGLELGRDQGIVLGPQVDLLHARVPVLGGQIVVALERLDLLDGDLQLVRDPRIGPSLADPGADLVEAGLQRATGHEARGSLAKS